MKEKLHFINLKTFLPYKSRVLKLKSGFLGVGVVKSSPGKDSNVGGIL